MNRTSKADARQQGAAATRFNPGAPPSVKRDWIFGLGLVLAVIVAYQPAWHAGFIWDDDYYVTGNKLLSAPDGLRRIWFSLDSPSQYFPLVYTVFRMEYALWGLNPAGYHWVNILLHATNALLVWRLLRRLDLPAAWLGAALWALHPVQVESVAWITELKNVLMCFFFLLTLLAWIGFVGEQSRRRWNFYALALVFYALALFSKTTACTLPAALLLILWLKSRPVNRQRLAQIIPFIVLGIGMGLLTVWIERYHIGTRGEFFAMGVRERMLVASRAVWFYAGKLFWPVNLTFSYPRWTISASDPLAYVWLVVTVGFGAAIYHARRYVGRSVGIAALFFISTLSPVLGFIMLYTFNYSFVADHYQYVASLGPITLVAAGSVGLANSFKRRNPLLERALWVGLLLALGTLSWCQARAYRSIETLWTDTLQKNPNCGMAHNNLGNALLKKGSADEAIAHFQKALEIKSDRATDRAEAHYNLGSALLQKGSVDEAIAHYQTALQINPDYALAHINLGTALLKKGSVDEAIAHFQKALQINPNNTEAHINLGTALLKKGNVDEAIVHYQMALQLRPDAALAHINLGNALLQKGDVDEAIAQFQKALEIKPDNTEAHNSLGSALLQKGSVDEAILHFQKALQIKPDNAEACYNLGSALLQKGSVDEATPHFQKALQIKPNNAEAHYNLGNILLKKGRVDEAMVHYQTALQLKPDNLAAQNSLAWVLAIAPQASQRNGRQAVELAQQANQLAGGENPIILRTLAAAYAEAGRFPEAVATAQRALQLAGAQSNPALANVIRSQLELYQAGTPFHLH
jgi:tetratricopeptide (TPR) repeat protein